MQPPHPAVSFLHSHCQRARQVLAKSGVTVRGISRKGTPKPEATFSDYLSADPCNPNEEVISRVRSASVIVSCVPPGPCVRALEALAPYMSEGCLFLDVLSVKTEICNSYNQLKVCCCPACC